MKRTCFLLVAVFLLISVSFLSLGAARPVQAEALQDPGPSDDMQIEGMFSGWKLFQGEGSIYIAGALAYLAITAILAIRDCIITQRTHGPGTGH